MCFLDKLDDARAKNFAILHVTFPEAVLNAYIETIEQFPGLPLYNLRHMTLMQLKYFFVRTRCAYAIVKRSLVTDGLLNHYGILYTQNLYEYHVSDNRYRLTGSIFPFGDFI